MSERGAGGKGKGSYIWEQLKSMGRGVLDGLWH